MGFFQRLTGAEQQANALQRADAATQEGIQRGLGRVDEYSPLIRSDIQGGIDQNLGYLDQARGQFQSASDLFNPAISNIQQTGTASGRSSELANILADPNNARLFDELNRSSQNNLSGLSARRSGFGLGQTESGQLNLANSLLDSQNASQQYLANAGGNANTNIANLFQQSGNVAGTGGVNLAGSKQNELAQILNLMGQGTQSAASSLIGQGNAAAGGMQSLLGLGGSIGGAAIGKWG